MRCTSPQDLAVRLPKSRGDSLNGIIVREAGAERVKSPAAAASGGTIFYPCITGPKQLNKEFDVSRVSRDRVCAVWIFPTCAIRSAKVQLKLDLAISQLHVTITRRKGVLFHTNDAAWTTAKWRKAKSTQGDPCTWSL